MYIRLYTGIERQPGRETSSTANRAIDITLIYRHGHTENMPLQAIARQAMRHAMNYLIL